jgi:hypothetical protein
MVLEWILPEAISIERQTNTTVIKNHASRQTSRPPRLRNKPSLALTLISITGKTGHTGPMMTATVRTPITSC